MKKKERDALLRELEDIDDRLYPKKGEGPSGKEYKRLDKLHLSLEIVQQLLPLPSLNQYSTRSQVACRSIARVFLSEK
ncbi:hypothetical protein ACFL2F_05365 [Myxococcota bacterium]